MKNVNQWSTSITSHLPDWMEHGLCTRAGALADAWFPADSRGACAQSQAAITVCNTCPVKQQCLDFAMSDPAGAHGIWGGLTVAQRENLVQERNLRKRRRGHIGCAVGTHRRLQALVAAGWPLSWIARRLPGGRRVENLTRLLHEQRIRTGTAQAVADLYSQLYDVVPPRLRAKDDGAVTQALRRAETRGWLPPSAWYGIDMDDPAARPRREVSRAA